MSFYEFIIHLPNKVFFPFSKNDQIHNHFQKTCCEHIEQNQDNINLCKYITTTLSKERFENFIQEEKKGNPNSYSINIFDDLDEDLKKKIIKFFNNNDKINKVSSMLGYKAKLRAVSFLINFHNENTNEIQGAKMFHRDSDSLQDQIKLFLLVKDIGEDCGNFYYVPKNFISDRYRLPYEEDRKTMRLSDKWRNYDDTVRLALNKFKINPENAIRKFKGKQGEAIYIDTGKVYHKGGFVKDKSDYRVLLQAVYTPYFGLSNWNGNKNKILSFFQNKLTNLRIKLRKEINI
jgi:hypothetical protein